MTPKHPLNLAPGVDLLHGAQAIVYSSNTTLAEDSRRTKSVAPAGRTAEVEFITRGPADDLPDQIIEKSAANVVVGANLAFLAQLLYGDGLRPMRRTADGTLRELHAGELPEVTQFLALNNTPRLLLEIANDLVTLGDAYLEIILDSAPLPAVAAINHLDSTCSRLSLMERGKVKFHGYSAQWNKAPEEDLIITPLIDRANPLRDLLTRTGRLPAPDGRKAIEEPRRYALQLTLPTPGRFYYARPPWWTIFQSGWYDYACLIIRLKEALIKNNMVLKYAIEINDNFFLTLFKAEALTDEKQQRKRRNQVLQQINDFLTGADNAGKSFVSAFRYNMVKGITEHDILIKPIEGQFRGGEYIEDSEESANMISYAMGVHPGIIGPQAGKNKTISGSETRELFIIKQALVKPLRELLIQPLTLVKALNQWPDDLEFHIANILLTTLDRGTGTVKQIGNQEV